MKKPIIALFAALALAAMLPVDVLADSIDPTSVGATIGVGESITIRKTVTVSEGTPVSSKVDVFFLTDATGSMGSAIANVKAGASGILTATSGIGDVAWGTGQYRDITDAFVYQRTQDITTSAAAAQAGINAWSASGGGDTPEANLAALEQMANTSSWRAGSERIAIWFGDAPGHDPRAGSTEASATAALQAKNIAVQAISVGFDGLDDTGQATRIAAATGGNFYSGINTSALVTTITDAITTAVSEYTTVALDLSEVPGGLSAASVPTSYVGSFDRSITRTFAFDLTFTGVTPGVYSFNVYGTVDGGRVATEADRITVVDNPVPEPGTLLLLGTGLLGMAGYGYRRRQSA